LSDLASRISSPHVEYALGHSSRELDRLSFQATVLSPYTRQFLTEAGIAPGMRVLDVGCGSGDVSFLAADLVGANGFVLGVDRSPAAVERATARLNGHNFHHQDGAGASPLTHVAFQAGDPASMHFEVPFDAVIGRFVLMYQDEPATSLRKIMRHVRKGGVVAFQELDSTACRSWPAAPSFDAAANWLFQALRGSGAKPDLGLEMNSLFLDCGLPSPHMRMDAVVSGQEDSPVYRLLAEAVRSVTPTLERLNIASTAQVQVDSLADRMRQEVAARRGIAMSYGLVGAFARKP